LYADSQERQYDGRVDDNVQDLLDEAHRHPVHLGVGSAQHGSLPPYVHLEAIQLCQKIIQVIGNKVNQPHLQGFVGCGGDGLFDSGLRPFHHLVSPASGHISDQ
jgi:hypothetical protein